MEWLQHYLYKRIKLVETYASVKEAIINGIISIRHNTVCLTSSFFTLVLISNCALFCKQIRDKHTDLRNKG